MKKTLKFLEPYTFWIILSTLCVFVQTVTNLYLPSVMSDIIDQGVVVGQIDKVYNLGYKMLIITLGAMIFNILATYIASKVSSSYGKDLRKLIYEKVQGFSLTEFNKINTSSLITRTTNDVTQVQNLINMSLRMMVMAPLMCIGGLILAINKNLNLSIIFIIIIPLLILFILCLVKFIVPLFSKVQGFTDRMNQVVREKLTGTRVIRAFTTEKLEKKKFEKANKDIYDLSIKISNIMSILMPVIFFLTNVSAIIIMYMGSHLIAENSLEIGDMMAFIQYAMQVLFSILMVTMMFIMIPRAIVSGKRIGEVLDIEPEIKDGNKKMNLPQRGNIEFKNVSFRYENSTEDIIHDMSFKINKGETVAIIGATGSSKTTILNLMLRFYDTTKGKVIIGGENVKDLSIKDIRDSIGYVPQKVTLFSGTIKSNILYGKQNATEEQILNATKCAEGYEFISKLENGFESEVAQGGTNYSGGQKQRISIARALVKDADIYMFDDSFSALDYATDKKLRNNLKKYAKDKTVIIVAQRVATVLDADKIIYIDEGKIVDIGNHKELFERCKEYKEIVLSQITLEEATKNNG